MATLTIRNLDENVKRRLQVRAALNGRSMEAEVRESLTALVGDAPPAPDPEEDLGSAIHKRFAQFGGVELDIPPRQPAAHETAEQPRTNTEEAPKRIGLGTAIHNLFAPLGGVELPVRPRRNSHRSIPTFEE